MSKIKYKYTIIRKHFCSDCGTDADLRLVQKYEGLDHLLPSIQMTLCPACLETRKIEQDENKKGEK